MPIKLPSELTIGDLLDDLDKLVATLRAHLEAQEGDRYRRQEKYDFETEEGIKPTADPESVAYIWALLHPDDERPITESWTAEETEGVILYEGVQGEEAADLRALQEILRMLAQALEANPL
jgi:hypothetical protein